MADPYVGLGSTSPRRIVGRNFPADTPAWDSGRFEMLLLLFHAVGECHQPLLPFDDLCTQPFQEILALGHLVLHFEKHCLQVIFLQRLLEIRGCVVVVPHR